MIFIINKLFVSVLTTLITLRKLKVQYDSQLQRNHNRHRDTYQNASFSGPARQMGAGADGLGLSAMRMGRVANLIVRRRILQPAKEISKKLLIEAVPEIVQVLTGKKRPSGKALKHFAETAAKKTVKASASRFSCNSVEVGGAIRKGAAVDQPDGRRAVGRIGPALDCMENSKMMGERFNCTIARVSSGNDKNHFQFKSHSEKSVRLSV